MGNNNCIGTMLNFDLRAFIQLDSPLDKDTCEDKRYYLSAMMGEEQTKQRFVIGLVAIGCVEVSIAVMVAVAILQSASRELSSLSV